MPSMERGPSPHRWNQIKRLPLHPTIRSLTDYEEAVKSGNLDALAFLRAINPLQTLGVDDLRQVHYQIFKAVHPWAGEFRTVGQVATVASYVAAEAPRIRRELELTVIQFNEVLQGALSVENRRETLGALAFFHVRFERVHPFLDGNGRTGRAVLAIQFEKVFGILPRFVDQAGYRHVLRASNARDLGPFIDYLGESIGLTPVQEAFRPRFQLHPRLDDGTTPALTFAEELARSRILS